MITMDGPCALDGPHPRHPVVDLIADPANDHVLYGDTVRECPGLSTTDWLARRDGVSHG